MSKLIVGIDEVGRGSWAGPLVVGAVILQNNIEDLADSKILSKVQRQYLALQIHQHATAVSTGWVEPSEVDALGLTAATQLAIVRAIESIHQYDEIIIDGSINFLPLNAKARSLIKADSLVPAVSAASIIAKVARDDYMAEQDLLYPQYGFGSHVGYGTAKHKQALVDHGVTPLHRLSYKPIKLILESGEWPPST